MSTFTLRPMRATSNEYLGNKVRVSFPEVVSKRTYNKSKKMVMIIGKDIAKQYGFKAGDPVVIDVHEENPYIWDLVKAPQGEDAWKLIQRGAQIVLEIVWNYTFIKDWGKENKFVSVRLINGKMQLLLPGYKEQEKIEA